jgi:hypothetical protein
MKKNRALTYNISFFERTMRRIYFVLAHDMRIKVINDVNQQKIINHVVKQNFNLHKDMNIVKIAWIKKTKRTKKEYAFLIIEFVSAKMTNRLIKDDLLNDYFYRACEYFEKECRFKQCFRCQKYDHVNKVCRNDVKCDFCAYEHFFDECKAINDHKKCVNCEEKHSTWNFQCVVKTREKKRLNIIWNNKLIMHTKTWREIDSESTNNLRVVDKEQSMISFVMFHSQANDATQQNT